MPSTASTSERSPLLPAPNVLPKSHTNDADGESFDAVPHARRQLTTTSAIFIVFNRIIGTGIYATPAFIFRSANSVGVALVMWLLGTGIAAAGTAVFVELGTGLPRSGGEKNYLEFFYRRPKFLTTCVFVVYAIMTGSGSANSVVFGEYTLHALSIPATPTYTHVAAVLVLTLTSLIHASSVKWGIRLQNILGAFKLVVLLCIGIAGIACGLGFVPLYKGGTVYERSTNFESWNEIWRVGDKTGPSGVNAFGNGMYSVIWSFSGYASVNSTLSEVRSPVKTLKRALPFAVGAISIVYLAVNAAYFAVISRDDMLRQGGDGKIIAALYFRNLFGPQAEKALSAFIALSTFGNLLAGQFGQGRVIQELGREGVLPYSSFFASSWPLGTPAAALFTQYVYNTLFILLPPAGDAYLVMVNISSYSSALINTLISAGLLALTLQTRRRARHANRPIAVRVTTTVTSDAIKLLEADETTLVSDGDSSTMLESNSYAIDTVQEPPAEREITAGKLSTGWDPPIKAPLYAIVLFFLSNVFLVLVPLVKPRNGRGPYVNLAYWVHPVASLSASLIGVVYWLVRVKVLPRWGGYVLEKRWVKGDDGVTRWVLGKARI